MQEKYNIGTVYPFIKKENFDGKEMFFGKNMIMSIPEKYFIKSQVKLFVELFHNFTAQTGKLKIVKIQTETPCVAICKCEVNNFEKIDLQSLDYEIKIDEEKALLYFNDNKSFAHAFCTFLQLIEVKETEKGKERFTLPICDIQDEPIVKFRVAHISMNPESSFYWMRKWIREMGFLKYSHLNLESFGCFHFNSLKEMYYKNGGFTKKQVKILVEEARALGMDVIPLLNVWGHAALNTQRFGKHIILDQNPKLEPLFNKTGWVWNILNPKVKELQRKLAEELIELCGDCEYFHIGCDEATTYGLERDFNGKDKIVVVCDYINEFSEWLKAKGKKTMMWADMLLRNPDWKDQKVKQGAKTLEEAKQICALLNKDIIMVDWQYSRTEKDFPSSKFLADYGFETMLASYSNPFNIKACVGDVIEHNYYGYMLTVWGSQSKETCLIPRGAIASWSGAEKSLASDGDEDANEENIMTYVTEILRKLMPAHGKYGRSGTMAYFTNNKKI